MAEISVRASTRIIIQKTETITITTIVVAVDVVVVVGIRRMVPRQDHRRVNVLL